MIRSDSAQRARALPEAHHHRQGESAFLSLLKRRLIARNHSRSSVTGYYTVPVSYNGRPHDLPFVYFVNRGCSYDRIGACAECNYGRGTRVEDEVLLDLVSQQIDQFRGQPALYVTPSGSMFDEAEVPEPVRLGILHKVREAGFEFLATETRPEFLSEANILQARAALGPSVALEVGMGLETANDWVRCHCVNKMLTLSCIADAIGLCKRCGVTTYIHVLTKPPFLNEPEAVKDAIDTIIWAFEHGADRLGLALTNIKPGTVTAWPPGSSIYQPPTYWSIIKILLSIPREWRGRIGLFGFDSAVTIERPASNCAACSPHVRSLLQAYCYTRDSHFLTQADNYPCRCRGDWLAAMDRPDLPLPERVARHYERLGRGILGDAWWLQNRDRVLAELDAP